ncbi:MAG: DUF4406 domain-containing protein [Patescibacteria group bacterium]|nr:DUF4406 domain-containing protein [Patescibacteria group bacterium]
MSTDRGDMAWYVCGPMTRVPRFNYPLFHLVAHHLRLYPGLTVISPTELDSKEMQAAAWASPDGDPTKLASETGETWGDVLARDVRLIEKQVGRFALLPRWQESRGARLEVFVGLLVGITTFKEVLFTPQGEPVLVDQTVEQIRQKIRENMP